MSKRWLIRCNIIAGIIAASCLGMIVIGCDKHDSTPRAATPRQVLENMRDAIIADNKEAFINCFDVRQIEKKDIVGGVYEVLLTMQKLDQALVQTYGRGFSKDEGGFPQIIIDEDWPQKVQITIEGGTAKVEDKHSPLELLKVDGVWRIETEMPPDWQDIDVALSELSAQAKAVEDMRSKVGQPGYSAEKIEEELMEAMTYAHLAALPDSYDHPDMRPYTTLPGIDAKPVVLNLGPVEVGTEVTLGDMVLGIPKGWKPGSGTLVEEVEGPYPGPKGERWRLPIVIVDGGTELSTTFAYSQRESWLANPDPGFLRLVKRYMPDPSQFLDEYASDLELFSAMHEVVPSDLKGTAGLDAARVKFLLTEKIVRPTKRLDSPGLHAFIMIFPRGRFVSAEVLDSHGVFRGRASLPIPEGVEGSAVQTLLAKLLVNSRFVDRP